MNKKEVLNALIGPIYLIKCSYKGDPWQWFFKHEYQDYNIDNFESIKSLVITYEKEYPEHKFKIVKGNKKDLIDDCNEYRFKAP